MRCDLHVHSVYSGRVDLPVLRHLGNESYSEPEAVYAVARRRGMDLVTLSDHDTIEGALQLAGRADTFASEEVTAWIDGRELHLGVIDLDERQHAGIQARSRDAEALFAYLAEERLPVVLNHPFSSLTGRRDVADLPWAARRATHVEATNSMMPAALNAAAARLAEEHARPTIGGSDAHALGSVALAWTEVPGARSREEFLSGLRRGACLARGRSGTYARLTRNVATIFGAGCVRTARDAVRGDFAAAARLLAFLALTPALPLVPLITALERLQEHTVGPRLARALWGRGPLLRPGFAAEA
jgi:predicted metal-dependent phosphoesterase TrpH